jgi:predicted nucleic acid-binding Zn ribbon protein
MTGNDPHHLSDALEEVGRQLGLSSPGAFAAVVATWSEVVGPDVATHARVRSLQDGECTVEVDEPAWATRVRYLGPELRRRANERSGSGIVSSVTVVVKTPRRAVR